MFIHDFAHLQRPYHRVREQMLDDDAGWIAELAVDAYTRGSAWNMKLGPKTFPSKLVTVHLEKPYPRGDGLVVPMHWVATGPSGLFPSMQADLGFAPVGDDETQVSLAGMYDPPLGVVGRTVDALVMHRVAEASVRAFLDEVVRALMRNGGSSARSRRASARTTFLGETGSARLLP